MVLKLKDVVKTRKSGTSFLTLTDNHTKNFPVLNIHLELTMDSSTMIGCPPCQEQSSKNCLIFKKVNNGLEYKDSVNEISNQDPILTVCDLGQEVEGWKNSSKVKIPQSCSKPVGFSTFSRCRCPCYFRN